MSRYLFYEIGHHALLAVFQLIVYVFWSPQLSCFDSLSQLFISIVSQFQQNNSVYYLSGINWHTPPMEEHFAVIKPDISHRSWWWGPKMELKKRVNIGFTFTGWPKTRVEMMLLHISISYINFFNVMKVNVVFTV